MDNSDDYIPGQSQVEDDEHESYDQPTDPESRNFGDNPNWPPGRAALRDIREPRKAANQASKSISRCEFFHLY